MEVGSNWACPHCGHHMVLSGPMLSRTISVLNPRSTLGNIASEITSISCANDACNEVTVDIRIGNYTKRPATHTTAAYAILTDESVLARRLLPIGKVMRLPKEIPEEIRLTYREAVLTAAVSGRSGAAMARRCLQGIVRDFWDIPTGERGKLGAELAFIKDRIDPGLWNDIQAVRSIGDIGAHMDKSASEIIDVTPDEARILISLIETLFQDWYIARSKRALNSSNLRNLLTDKRSKQKAAKEATKGSTAEDVAEASST